MKSEIRSQKSEVRNQKSEIRSQNLSSVLCRLFSVFCLLSSVVCLLAMLLVEAGCEQPPIRSELPADADNSFNRFSTYASEKINILPLTEFIDVGDAEQSKIILYVSLLDSFGSQIKSPGVFRFELYERVLRSSEPKGKRVVIWQDIDLTDPVKNNDHWRDFLRAYEFNLPFEPGGNQSYILQATCLCPSGKRLSAEFALKRTK